MAWWTNAQAIQTRPTVKTNGQQALPPRPLSSWVRVKGRISSEETWGWIVEAEIEQWPGASTRSSIMLVNPPKEEKLSFDRLKAEVKQDQETQASANSAANANQEILDEASSKAAALEAIGSTSLLLQNEVRGDQLGYLRAAGNASERKRLMIDKSAAASEAALKASIELKEMPSGEQYTVDFFALRTGQKFKGLSVYDFGMVPLAAQLPNPNPNERTNTVTR